MTGLLGWGVGVPALLPLVVSFRDLGNWTPASLDQCETRDAPETTVEAPFFTPNLHGAWPNTVLYPTASPGLDLSFTGQPTVSTAFGQGSFCFFVISGKGERGILLFFHVLIVKRNHLSGAGLWLTLCVLDGG